MTHNIQKIEIWELHSHYFVFCFPLNFTPWYIMKRKRDGEFLQLFNLPIALPSFWKRMQDHLHPYQCIVSFYLMIQTVCQASKSQMLVQWCTETCCWGQIFKIWHETMSLHLLPDNGWMLGNQELGCESPPKAWPEHVRWWHGGGTWGAPARSPTIRPGRVNIPPGALLDSASSLV